MNWLAVGVIIVILLHLTALISGRKTNTRTQRVAFISGILGFFSFPVLIYLGFKSFCIAGSCRYVDDTALQVLIVAFVALTLLSAISVAVIFVRRSRA